MLSRAADCFFFQLYEGGAGKRTIWRFIDARIESIASEARLTNYPIRQSEGVIAKVRVPACVSERPQIIWGKGRRARKLTLRRRLPESQ